MRTHDQVVAKLMRRPGVRKEVERIEREEGALLDLLLSARHDATPGLPRHKLPRAWELSPHRWHASNGRSQLASTRRRWLPCGSTQKLVAKNSSCSSRSRCYVQKPNPYIERTASDLRPPAAAHVKRAVTSFNSRARRQRVADTF
jgi:hypothetical protein